MAILITIAGIASLVYGILVIFGIIKTDISKDDEMSKRLLSERNRYLFGRYNAGFKFVIAGLGAIALGLMMYFSQ